MWKPDTMNGFCFDSGLNKPTAQTFLGEQKYLNIY